VEAPDTGAAARRYGGLPPPPQGRSTTGRPSRARSLRSSQRVERALLGLLLTVAAVVIGASWLDARLATTPPFVPSRSVYDAYVDSTPVTVSISVPGR
jgi:hypothetical protein